MKLTRKQLYEVIRDLKPDQYKYPDISSVVQMVTKKMKIPESARLKAALKVQLNAFKRSSKSGSHRNISTEIENHTSDEVIENAVHTSGKKVVY